MTLKTIKTLLKPLQHLENVEIHFTSHHEASIIGYKNMYNIHSVLLYGIFCDMEYLIILYFTSHIFN